MVFHLLYVIYIFHDFLFSFVLLETPFAALTGTADADTCSVIISTLCLKDPLMVHVSPNRNNLRLQLSGQKKMPCLQNLTGWFTISRKKEN